ncbi:MAG TPA: hypothetical protein VK550_05600 [Polyangiaceae bacterium]|nr:hypothetical protein [Polyangiaceae bacterium]
MPRIPGQLAIRIDRLARTAHRFHRFAHHPLCHEYGGEVVRIGRRSRVCRGCLFVASGGVMGVISSFFFGADRAALLSLGVAGLGAVVVTSARRSARSARAPKLASRFLPALVTSYLFGSAVQLGVAGWALAAVGAVPVFVLVAWYRRRGPDRTPCASCSERNLATPCRGIAPIVRRERAFRRLAGQWVSRVDP